MRTGLHGAAGALLALLLTQQAPLTSGVCSSLQGPFCKEVNGLSPPRRVLDDAWPGKQAGGGGAGTSLKEVNAKLLAALRSLKPRKIIAAFEMHGSMVARTGRVELSAGPWLGKAPKGWITVGLKGVLAASGKLLLRATDEQGVNMEGCSEMTLLRRRPRGGGGNAAAKIAGTWAGSYSCHGVPTKLELELQRDDDSSGGGGGGAATAASGKKSVPLLGTFSFRAKSQAKLRDLLDGELGLEGLEGLVGGRGLPSATPARRRATRAGCSCAMNWRRGSKLLRGGVCAAAPPDGTASGEWCVVDEATCAEGQQPAGKDEDTGVAWDFCVPNPQDEEGAAAGQAAAGQAGRSERLPTPTAQGQAAAAAARTGTKEESERRRHPQQPKPSKRKPKKKPKLKKKKPAPAAAAAAKKKVKKQKKKAKAPVKKKKAKVPVKKKKKVKMKTKKKKSSRKGAR